MKWEQRKGKRLLLLFNHQGNIAFFAQLVHFKLLLQRSPDFNALDLGAWYSLSAGVPSLKTSSNSGRTIDRIIFHVLQRWENWDAVHRLMRIFTTKASIMSAVVTAKGSNEYKLPRSNYSHKDDLPTYLPPSETTEQRHDEMEEARVEEEESEENEESEGENEGESEESGVEEGENEENGVESDVEEGYNEVEEVESEEGEVEEERQVVQSVSQIFANISNGNEVLQYWQRQRALRYHQWGL